VGCWSASISSPPHAIRRPPMYPEKTWLNFWRGTVSKDMTQDKLDKVESVQVVGRVVSGGTLTYNSGI
jgi:hypothetical protein